jgi:hypothetical protein
MHQDNGFLACSCLLMSTNVVRTQRCNFASETGTRLDSQSRVRDQSRLSCGAGLLSNRRSGRPDATQSRPVAGGARAEAGRDRSALHEERQRLAEQPRFRTTQFAKHSEPKLFKMSLPDHIPEQTSAAKSGATSANRRGGNSASYKSRICTAACKELIGAGCNMTEDELLRLRDVLYDLASVALDSALHSRRNPNGTVDDLCASSRLELK